MAPPGGTAKRTVQDDSGSSAVLSFTYSGVYCELRADVQLLTPSGSVASASVHTYSDTGCDGSVDSAITDKWSVRSAANEALFADMDKRYKAWLTAMDLWRS